jgi:hypothetical protein
VGARKAVAQKHLRQARAVHHRHAHLKALRAASRHGRLRRHQCGFGRQGLDLERGRRGLCKSRQSHTQTGRSHHNVSHNEVSTKG